MDRTAYQKFCTLDQYHFWRVSKRRLVLDLIEKFRPRPKSLRILDIGGACSMISQEMRRFGEVTVIESDQEILELAKDKFQSDIRQGSLPDHLPVDGPFDLVTLLDVLEHVAEDEESLQAIWKLLRPGGVLICTVPALPWLWSEHDVTLHHERRYVSRELEKKLKQAGFKIIRLSYYTSMLFPLLAAERLWSRIMPRKNRGYNVSLPAPWVNSMLGGIMSIERAALLHFNLPVGSALFAVGQRPAAGNF